MKNIPNILTIIRFCFVPGIVLALAYDHYLTAFILLTLSSLTDVLDGTIARKYNFITDFGKLMDPLADKVTQLATLITLTAKGIIPVWIVLVLILKEAVMISGASFLYGKELVVSSKWYGKLTTVLLYVAIISSLGIRFFNIGFNFDRYIYYVAVAFALYSLIRYIDYFYNKGYLPDKQQLTKDSSK